jgi:transglutaminase-like putative cysteine protease
MQILRIEHVTEYRFGRAVTLLPHRLLLRPRESHSLRIVSSELAIHPAHEVRWSRDVLDNSIALVAFQELADHLRIGSTVVVEHYDDAPLDFLVESRALTYPFAYSPDEAVLLAPFRVAAAPGDHGAVEHWLRELGLLGSSMETYVLLARLNAAIHQRFRCQVREEAGVWSPAQTLANETGACRDLAALFVDACRCLGLASRFVSGYQHAPISESGHGSTHAWGEVYLPGAGWKGFDPSSGELTGNRHIAVAVAKHPEEVPPVAGSFKAVGGAHPSMHVFVSVRAQPAA